MTRVARVALLALITALTLGGLTAAPARAADSQAVVIVETPNGTYTRVISFGGAISGLDALRLAGANPVVAASDVPGAAVCQLFGVGNPATDDDTCLGQSNGGVYWAYFRAPGGDGPWQYSNLGASASTVRDGDVEGWSFGMGSPPFQSFCDVVGCAPPPAPEPPPAPGPAATPEGVAGPTGAASAGGTAGDSGTAAAVDGSATAETPAATTPDGTTPATTARGATAAERSRAADRQALGRPTVAADEGSGSPVGVLVAVGLVALIGGAAVVVRRRRAAGPAD